MYFLSYSRSNEILFNFLSNLFFSVRLILVFLSISFNLFLILILSYLSNIIPNLIIYFLISSILESISLTGSNCRYSKYFVSARCFCDLNKMYIRSDLVNPVVYIFRNWANFFKVSRVNVFNLMISFKSLCVKLSLLDKSVSLNFFNSFNSLMINWFCLFCKFLYISCFKFFNFCLWWYLYISSTTLAWFFLWISLKSASNMFSTEYHLQLYFLCLEGV